MQYKAIINSSPYIMHFNKNHNPANGQFAPGDGDGDGIVNDHKYAYTKDGSKKTNKYINSILETSTAKENAMISDKEANKKLNKTLNKFIKSSRKDEEEAFKNNDLLNAKTIAAGRTFMRTLIDEDFKQQLIDGAAPHLDIDPNKTYNFQIKRDDAGGGVVITAPNGKSIGVSDSILDYEPGKEFVEQHNRNVQEQAFRDSTDTAIRNHQDMVNQAIINEGQRFMEEMNRNQMLQQMFF